MADAKPLAVTKAEAELLFDSFKASNPQTRALALKAAGLVLEWEAAGAVDAAATQAEAKRDG